MLTCGDSLSRYHHFFLKFCLSRSALKSQQYILIFLFLVQANVILLPLEAVLSKDVAAITDAMARERVTSTEISPIHGQAIYQSYCLRIREACQTFKPMVPSLTLSVKGLYSMLTRLARTASLHAGNLHKVFLQF